MQKIEQNPSVSPQYNSIDLCKFIMSFAVVAAHTQPFVNMNNIVVQRFYSLFTDLAVPFFFLASGYLLAVKMDYPYGSECDLLRVKKQFRVILRMYLTWTVIYAPLAVYYYIAAGTPIMTAVLYYLRGFIFVGEQYNSWPLWYLLSTIYALLVIGFVLKSKRSPSVLLAISIIASIFSLGFTELADYNGNLPTLLAILQKLIQVSIVNGRILSGLIYIPIGMLLAHKKIPRFLNWGFFIAGVSLFYFSHHSLISKYLLIITGISFFGIVESIPLKNRPIYSRLRNMSSIIYLTHTYIWTFYYCFVYGQKTYGLDSFIITSCVALAVSAFVVFVKNREGVRQKQTLPSV